MMVSSYETFQGFIASLSLGEDCRLPGALPNSSARYDLAVVVSRPVSIFLRVLTGFFMPATTAFPNSPLFPQLPLFTIPPNSPLFPQLPLFTPPPKGTA